MQRIVLPHLHCKCYQRFTSYSNILHQAGTSFRTFVPGVSAHPYCTRDSCCNVTPRHALNARTKKEMCSCFDKTCAQQRKSVRHSVPITARALTQTSLSGVQLAWLIFCCEARRTLPPKKTVVRVH